MLLQLTRLLVGFRGRLSRFTWWVASVMVIVIFAVLFVFIEDTAGRPMTLMLYPFVLWPLLALAVKRMHDRGRSSFLLLAAVIPILGPLWLLFELGLCVGTPGENQYGADPLEGADYLTVA